MLKKVAEGVLTHESEFIKSNAVVVQGKAGVLLVDAGLTNDEMSSIANDLEKLGQPVVAGFSTHPHWDHVLWHDKLGDAPRYGTARAAALIKTVLANPNWKKEEEAGLPPEVAGQVPLDDRYGQFKGLPAGAKELPWDGPEVTVIEHNGHAPGHAALLIKEYKTLVAGDMLSDVLVPMLDLSAADPVKDYLAALNLLEDIADKVNVVIPGHGSVGNAEELRTRIKQDRAYVEALRDGKTPDDPRLTAPKEGWDWVASIHEWQAKQIAEKLKHDGTSK